MMSRPIRRRRALLLAVLVTATLTLGLSSCSRRLGWGLVLWTAAEGPIPAGSVVPVYIRSNINKVFVVGSLDGKKKLELPFWQVELFSSRGKAKAAAEKFASMAPLYLIATRDGLPVRDSPVNLSDNKVYRLRQGQSVKILDKVKGEEVRTGDTVLQGDWYFVLTDDGTRGYVFSNTMELFDESKESTAPALAVASSSAAVKIDFLFSRPWRPEYFQSMIDDGRIDLDTFNLRFGLFADAVHRQIRIELPAASEVFQYDSIAEEGGAYVFEGTPLRIRLMSERRLEADWTGLGNEGQAGAPAEAAATTVPADSAMAATPADTAAPSSAPGASGKATFLVISSDVRDAIRTEELRRRRLLDTFLVKGSEWTLLASPPAASPAGESPLPAGGSPADASAPTAGADSVAPVATPSASRLSLSSNGRFSWLSFEQVPPGYLPLGLPPGQPATGEAAFRLYLGRSLQASWAGILSLRFDNAPGSNWVDFLYRMDGESLVLVPVADSKGLEATAASPLLPLRFAPSRSH
jgi:hypothetical protein